MISLDWSRTKPLTVFNGESIDKIEMSNEKVKNALTKLIGLAKSNGNIILTENIPHMLKRGLLEQGVDVVCIHPYIVYMYTSNNSTRNNTDYEETSDEYDAKAIYSLYQEHPEYFRKQILDTKKETLRDLVKNYEDIQELRKKIGSRQYARGGETNVVNLEKMEKDIQKQMEKQIELYSVYNIFLKLVDGIGVVFSAKLIANIDISIAHNPSALLKYCGMGVTNGKADGRIKGQICSYNPCLKTICYLIGKSLIKNNIKYREIYNISKKRYELHEKYKEGEPIYEINGNKRKQVNTQMHRHMMAMRQSIKQFLCDLWSNWRRLECLSVTEPYPIKMLGHKHMITDNPNRLEYINLP